MTQRHKQIRLTACACSVLLALAVIILCNVLPLPKDLARFLVNKSPEDGVDIYAAQNFMWIGFFWGLAELLVRYLFIKEQEHELTDGYLPENPEAILTANSMSQINRSVAEKHGSGTLAALVRLIAYQFQLSRSVGMCQSVLNAEVESRNADIDLGYNILRYIAWMLPTLGFIGTVWGILSALSVAAGMDPTDKALLPTVISSMSVAFWTTLLALIMSCIIMYLMHYIQGKEENYLNACSRYCLKNFINRLYEN